MNKTQRLSSIIEILENHPETITADDIANQLSASTRTIYRDIAALTKSGIPITGEAGIGYTLNQNQTTAPTMFTTQELEALTLGAHMIKHWSGGTMKDSAATAIEKINMAAPSLAQNNVEETTLFYPPSKTQGTITIDIPTLRHALHTKHKITFETMEDGTPQPHKINPLCAAFFGPSWLLVGWCETTESFKNFKLETMQNLTLTEEKFDEHDSATLQGFIEWMQPNPTPSTAEKPPSTETISEPHPAPSENTPAPQTPHAATAV